MSTHLVSVNHSSVCSCQISRFPTFRLALRTFWLDLNETRAVAISYAIGDYARACHILGRRDGAPDLAVSLQFGVEGDIHDLKHLLVELSKTNQAIWIDQLSIPQTSQKEIRTHLERIPQIYGTLEVVVLLPNAPCHCLQESLSAYEEGTMFLAKDGDFDLLEVSNRCMSPIPLCSYYLRLWTKHEFTYAKTIWVRYASGSKTQCSRQLGSTWMLRYGRYNHWDYMGTFCRHYYEVASSEAAVFDKQADAVAWSQLKVLIDDIRIALNDAIHLFYMVGQAEENDLYLFQHTYLYIAKFLLGQRLERQAHNGEREFFPFGSYSSGHRVTVENDYALVVFLSHKSYRIPSGWQGTVFDIWDCVCWKVHR